MPHLQESHCALGICAAKDPIARALMLLALAEVTAAFLSV